MAASSTASQPSCCGFSAASASKPAAMTINSKPIIVKNLARFSR
jgi:hypothetical protein